MMKCHHGPVVSRQFMTTAPLGGQGAMLAEGWF